MKSINRKLGRQMKLLRNKAGFTQSEVARELNISCPAYSKIEAGITDVNISRLIEISDVFKISVNDFFKEEDENDQFEITERNPIKSLKDTVIKQNEIIYSLQNKIIKLYEAIPLQVPNAEISEYSMGEAAL